MAHYIQIFSQTLSYLIKAISGDKQIGTVNIDCHQCMSYDCVKWIYTLSDN